MGAAKARHRCSPLKLHANPWRVLDAVRAKGEASRAQLVNDTGLSWASVAKMVSELLERGLLLQQNTAREGKAGPEAGILRINPGAGYLLGIEIGATLIEARLLDFAFRPVEHPDLTPMPTGCGASSIRNNIRSFVSAALDRVSEKPLLGLGLSWPGAVDPERGMTRAAPSLGLRDIELSLDDMLTADSAEQVQNISVRIDHDAVCAALAEQHLGSTSGRSRREQQSLIVLLEAGVGLGLVLNGEAHRGANNAGGAFGHIRVNPASEITCQCGQTGCLDEEISARAIVRKAGERKIVADGAEVTIHDLVAIAESGSDEAQALFADVGYWLGLGLSYYVTVLNPAAIVISGSVAHAYDLFYLKLRETLEEHSWRYALRDLRIERSRLGTDAVAFGAAISAYQRLAITAPV